jgi:nickel/cobalt transporter (NiCoT) family protein
MNPKPKPNIATTPTLARKGTSTTSLIARLTFTTDERRELTKVYGVVAFLHVLGAGSFLHYAASYPSLVGLGLAAYMFGLRHAFDADHIAAVDDTVRYLIQKGRNPLGTGFYFSLGHSTVVLLLSIAIVFAAAAIKRDLPELRNLGSVIGAGVSGTFLWVIGALNLLVLLNILEVWHKAGSGQHSHAHLEELLAQRGLVNRMFGGRLRNVINHSWQMYPLGLLFGIGFDTASEVGLLGMTAGASAGNLPVAAALSLPVLFAAGMSLMDTTDGVLMAKAYNWAFINPLRKIFYNLATTALSIAVALLIGTVELLQVIIGLLDLKGPWVDFVGRLDFGAMGYAVVGLFVLAWAMSLVYWKFAPERDPRFYSEASGTATDTHIPIATETATPASHRPVPVMYCSAQKDWSS